jgi:predicted transposase YbfD/YdcC
MLARSKQEFIDYFNEIDDPRQDSKLLYPLHEVLFLVLVGVLGCAEDWEAIVAFGELKLQLLRKYFPYEHGIPSISTLMRVMGLIDKTCIESWLNHHAKQIVGSLKGELVVLDGKALRGKKKFSDESQNTHTLNVFASKLGIALSQKAIPDKGSEISAINEILDHANLDGATISIDAIGCQFAIAEKIINKGGEYFLALKANQGTLMSDVESMFAAKNTYFPLICERHDKGHGRVETRTCETLGNIEWLKERHPQWKKLTSIAKVTAIRRVNGSETNAIRYYISSQAADAQKHLERARSHWSVENNLHWVLDAQFNEDDSFIRKNNAAENMAAIRKMALNIIKYYKKQTGKKRSTNGFRRTFGWSEDVMVDILDSWIHNCS